METSTKTETKNDVACVLSFCINTVAAMSVGMTLLVARRLTLMRDHWEAASLAAEMAATGREQRSSFPSSSPGGAIGSDSVKASTAVTDSFSDKPPVAAAATAAASVAASAKANAGGGWSGRGVNLGVVEQGVFLLALEVSAMLWVVGGWSSIAALRFRCVMSPLLLHWYSGPSIAPVW